jgi:uncharacterized protein YijF (DUF1287 family)
VKTLAYLESFGIPDQIWIIWEYSIYSFNYCGDGVKRRGVCTDVLNAHLTGKAVPCKQVPEDVRDAFERMELFHMTRSSHAETMVCVKYNLKLGTFEVPQHSKTGGT